MHASFSAKVSQLLVQQFFYDPEGLTDLNSSQKQEERALALQKEIESLQMRLGFLNDFWVQLYAPN